MLLPLSQLPLLPLPGRIQDQPGTLLNPHQTTPATRGPASPLPPEAYRLLIAPNGVTIESADPAGTFYARMTLRQIARVCPGPWPCGIIDDAPTFPTRGVMLDISRDKVPTLATLYALIDQFAEWKLNRLELYTEHTFAYRHHERVWRNADPMTPEDIHALDRFCRERGIDLVPNQNCFGHFERWLKHPGYRHLAECPDGFRYPWGSHSPCGTTLNPLDPASIGLISELLEELLPAFSSHNLNVGCDETWELGQGRSRASCEAVGKGRVYLDFLLKIHALAQRHGRRMHFWGDVILHHPELIPEIPRDSVALAWGYEAKHPFEQQGAAFAASGIPFFVCPGTSTWLSIAGRTNNAIANLAAAATAGHRHGASGYLITDWGDRGHWQYLPVSLSGFALGAALAWDHRVNDRLVTDRDALCRHLDAQVFHDRAGSMARAFHDLGNLQEGLGCADNGNTLFRTFNAHRITCESWRQKLETLGIAPFRAIAATLADLATHPPAARMQREDADLILAEYAQALRMLNHGCLRALHMLNAPEAPSLTHLRDALEPMIREHRRLWLARNRPGGLADSAGRMEQCLQEYLP